MSYELLITRVNKSDKQVLGQIDVFNSETTDPTEFTCFCLELPDLNNDGIEGNETRKSCIPVGEYPMTYEDHPKFGWCYRVHDVPGRSGILIHSGTHYKHTAGCILPATDQRDITGDGIIDNVSSKKALKKLVSFKATKLVVKEI